jgi:hypothetical protein
VRSGDEVAQIVITTSACHLPKDLGAELKIVGGTLAHLVHSVAIFGVALRNERSRRRSLRGFKLPDLAFQLCNPLGVGSFLFGHHTTPRLLP